MHLVFDMDGVLLDSESDLSWLDRALTRTLRDLDLPVTAENRDALFPTTDAAFEDFATRVGTTPEELWSIRDQHYQTVKLAAIDVGELKPYQDCSHLYSLPDDVELHIISNSPGPVVEQFVETNGYTDLFTETLGRGSTYAALDNLKPHPHLYEQLTRATVTTARPFTYVGHTETDRQFAANTDMEYLPLDRTGGETLETIVSQVRTDVSRVSSETQP